MHPLHSVRIPEMQNSDNNKIDIKLSNHSSDSISWDPLLSKDIDDGLNMVWDFLEDCESSDQVGTKMDVRYRS